MAAAVRTRHAPAFVLERHPFQNRIHPETAAPVPASENVRLADYPFRAVRRLVWRHDIPAPWPAGTASPARPVVAARFPALSLLGLAKRFGDKIAVDGISLDVPAGSFYGVVGPNGAGKTTTLSMATGLLRPDFGTALVHGVDVWQHPLEAKKLMGILPDGVRLFDRLSGEQLVTYAGLLRGMDRDDGGVAGGGTARCPGPGQ